MLKGKKIVIGITGSIAAYKVPFLIRLLKKEGAEVQVLMTHIAKDFVTPLTLSTLTERPVLVDFYDKDDGSWFSHVDLGLWADLMIIAPLSANTMAKMATGVADNLLLTTILSARCPVYFAPAMDLDMYKHPSTTNNISILKSFGYKLIEPVEGELASGLKGVGRLEEPENIIEILKHDLAQSLTFSGKKVLVSAGPTHEPIDPVRFIGNHSSGRMGIEIALAFAEQGALVSLVLGPSNIDVEHPLIHVVRVTTAAEMFDQCTSIFPRMDIAVMSAAVADFTPEIVKDQKIKKDGELSNIRLKPTKDIVAALGKMKSKDQLLVGFALETENEIEHANNKLKNKNLDLIVLNSLQDKGAGFGYDTNKVTILSKSGGKKIFPLKPKKEVATDILHVINSLSE
jgi:phosphopantothenoylcysteine decarboxylase/phosphopantothenate--cysteine ligase